MVVELAGWKPTIDKAVVELREDIGDLRHQVNQLSKQQASAIKPAERPPLLPTSPGSRPLPKEEETCPSHGDMGHGPLGHRAGISLRGKAIGENTSPLSLPGKGTFTPQFASRNGRDFGDSVGRNFGGFPYGGVNP
ncbi:hypothetical protein OsJ_14170 [Oryza sativa Japonica Group]|nr:hypothetical protein OsJ_14170 [Oryza sativa Japonica Group]